MKTIIRTLARLAACDVLALIIAAVVMLAMTEAGVDEAHALNLCRLLHAAGGAALFLCPINRGAATT